MGYRDNWTPCDEEKHCYYHEYRSGGFKGCRILNSGANGMAPFKPGKCPFYKHDDKGISGRYADAGSS